MEENLQRETVEEGKTTEISENHQNISSNPSHRKGRKRRKKSGTGRNVAIFLILVLAVVGVGCQMAKKYLPSKEMADLWEYYEIENHQAAVCYNGEVLEEKAIVRDGEIYISLAQAKEVFNDRFYYDYNEDLLLYAMPDHIQCAGVGDTGFSTYESYVAEKKKVIKDYGIPLVVKKKTTVYVAIQPVLEDYVYNIGSVSYETEPNRVVINTVEYLKASDYMATTKEVAVRKLGGIKSPILRKLSQGENVIVMQELESWTEVVTKDGLKGYVQTKRLVEGEEFPCEKEKEEPVVSNLVRDKKINLAWHQTTSYEANEKITELLDGTSGINVISPTWFALSDNEGNFTNLGQKSYVNLMHQRGIEVWGLISNFEHDVEISEMLNYTSRRQNCIKKLIRTSKKLGLDGINLDFEQISKEDGEGYIQFVRELSVACRKNNLVLSIDNYVPTGYTAHYNRKEQGIFADYVVIMGYDEHYGGSQVAGSVASIGFVKEGIEMTTDQVEPSKVINAIPFYTRIWKKVTNSDGSVEVSSEAAGMERVERLIAEKNLDVGWSEECGQFYTEWQEDGATYKIWIENDLSIEEKMKLIQEYKLAGVAEWKLGFQKNTVWSVIKKYIKSKSCTE